MMLLIGSLTIGLILSLLALGVYISFKVFSFADITTEGSLTLGAAVAAVLIVRGVNPLAATMAGGVAGMAAGCITGLLHTRCGVHALLSGILVMTALYSVNLRVMGRSNIPLMSVKTLPQQAGELGDALFGAGGPVPLWGWTVEREALAGLAGALLVAVLVALLLYLFFKTNLGSAMRATGDNAQMMRAQGIHTGNMLVLGLAISNGLVALAGALLAQFQGFADVQMGIGMLVWGLASVIIGQALVGPSRFGLAIVGAVMGAVLFRLLVAIALRWGLNPNDLKLMTALFVLAALVLPTMLRSLRQRKAVRHA